MLDTASFVTGVRSSEGAAGEIIRMILQGEMVCLMDLKLGLEYRDVALRPEHLSAAQLTRAEMLRIIALLEDIAEHVRVRTKLRPLSPDPNDDMILDIAINGRPDALVTNNTKHFFAAASRFEIPVLSPAELLRKIKIRKG